MPIVQINKPVESVITLEDARRQCQLDPDITDEDGLLEAYIEAATEYCEAYTGRPLITQEWQYHGNFLPCIELSPCLLSVESISYVSVDGSQKSLSPDVYFVNTVVAVGKVQLLEQAPLTKSAHPQPVTVNFTCGYGAASDVPEPIKQCVRLLVGHWFRNRELQGAVSGSVADTACSLLNRYCLVTIA